MQKTVHRIHFLGICGTAMGAVAAAFRELGYHGHGVRRQRLSSHVHLP